MTRTRLLVGALVLVLAGVGIGRGWSVVAHTNQDHLQHHVLIVLANELLRRDPSLAAVVNAALGVPETVTAPVVEEPETPAAAPDSP